MKTRYLLSVSIVAALLISVAPASWSQPVLPDKPPPNGGEEIVQSGSLTLDHPLPAGEVVRQGAQSTLAGWTTLMTQNFEGAFPATGWTAFDNDGATNGEYYWDDDNYKPHWGSWSAWCADAGANGLNPEFDLYPNNAKSWLMYGPFDLSSHSDAELQFYYWNQSEAGYDYFRWTASTNGTNFYGTSVSGDSGGWQYVNFDLTNVPTLGDVTGDSSVWIAFIFNSDNSFTDDGAFVDDITLRAYEGAKVYLPLVLGNHGSFNFQPNPDGYSFANYGNSHTWEDDLGAADLINMFGASKVCASGSTPADCVLTSSAESWRYNMLTMAGGGHCEGMAATSLRLYEEQAYYTGDTTPGDFQAGAQKTYDLTRDQTVDNYIAYYFVLQDVEEIWIPTDQIRVNNTPKQILELVRQELQGGNDPYSLGIYQYEGGSYKWGHAITPYAIEDRGGGDYWLYVYDNNYPNQERHIVFDTNADTWTYVTGYGTYQGNASTHSLDLTRTSYRNQEPFTPPFAVTSTAVEFFLTNGGDMLITDAAGQSLGYDPVAGQMVDEIPGAQIIPLRGAQGHIYRLPLQEAGKMYNVTVSGQALTGEVSTNLVMVGPGYVVGFEDIQLHPDQVLRMSLSADGRQLLFEEGQAAPAPQVFMAIDDIEP